MSQARPLRTAAIDVGSNSIKMLAADQTQAGFFPIWESRRTVTVRLQSGLKDGMLDEAALKRATDAIGSLYWRALTFGAEKVVAYGTSALRDAKNADVLCERIRKRFGIELRVVSAASEAQNSFAAAAPSGRAIAIDVGGGSTEVSFGTDGKPERSVSIHHGAVSLMNATAGMGAETVAAYAADCVSRALADLPQADRPVTLCGGTASCGASVLFPGEKEIEGLPFSRAAAVDLYGRLWSMTPEQRRAMPGMRPDRTDILQYGLALLIAIESVLHIEETTVTKRNSLYGFAMRTAAGTEETP